MLEEIDYYRDLSNENFDQEIYFQALSELKKRIFRLENLLDPNYKWEDFEKKVESSDSPSLKELFEDLKEKIKKSQKSTIRGWLKESFSDDKKNYRKTGWLNSPDLEPYFGKTTLMLLNSYVVEIQNVGELVKSNRPADIAKVKILTELLKLKKNDGMITKEEAIFFKCLLAAVKLEKSIDGAPVLEILAEDLLRPEIVKIREWIRKLITG
ncbi:MAG: hypothetical protein ABIE14_02265, partial [Patescibacteria group bacterium]